MAFLPERQKTYSSTENVVEFFKMGEVHECTTPDYNLEETKELDKFIKDCEKLARNTFEYQTLVMYLRNYMNMDHCAFFKGVSNFDTTGIKIHVHHSPITLYEIVVIIMDKRKFYNESLDIEMVAKEVIYVHYCALIGLIPLCQTVHKLVHSEYIFVPNDCVYGNFDEFLRMYAPFIPNEISQKMDKIHDFTKVYNEAENLQLLQPHYIYIDYVGEYKLPKLDDIMAIALQRMQFLQSNAYSMEPKPLFRLLQNREPNN